ncbi:hypothetical protein GCM10007100_40410 [Roseibacillus persicicus]|uniref:Uncharacterized protein n=1 Tax=Roseibacillus persicicus TaxID=454148 RepID=A0A918TZI5_9BACT|nr:hypothetical protein GCM10007100_40410 [Roseibacillus persicicus]
MGPFLKIYRKAQICNRANNAQHHKSDRAGESEVDGRVEGGRTIESALGRSDWVCCDVLLKNEIYTDFGN